VNDWIDPDTDRDYRTVVPPALMEEYYFSLGQLMHQFTTVESALNAVVTNFLTRHLLKHMTGLALLKAAYGGMRAKAAGETIKRINRAARPQAVGTPKEALLPFELAQVEIEAALKQLSSIQELRDRLAHHYVTPDMTNKGGWFSSSNYLTREPERADTLFFTPAMLRAAAADLQRVPDHVDAALNAPYSTDASRILQSLAKQRSDQPWHYSEQSLRRDGLRHGQPRKG